MSAEMETPTETAPRTRKPRGPNAAHTAGSLSHTLRLLGAERFAAVCEEHKDDAVFTKALRALARTQPELRDLVPATKAFRESAKVNGAGGVFVGVNPIAAPGDSLVLSVEGDAIVIRRA